MKEQKTYQDKEELSRYKKIWYQANKERISKKQRKKSTKVEKNREQKNKKR